MIEIRVEQARFNKMLCAEHAGACGFRSPVSPLPPFPLSLSLRVHIYWFALKTNIQGIGDNIVYACLTCSHTYTHKSVEYGLKKS